MDIQGFENYTIYPDGKVYNKKTKRYLSNWVSGQYLSVELRNHIGRKLFRIHRLLGTHYIPNPDNKPIIDHINRDKLDNRLENLRWVTNSENQHNTGTSKNNSSGYKNVSLRKDGYYQYRKEINGVLHQKIFKTLEEAVEYKDSL